ncbi:hypothetical protein OH76DRAFT_1410933 [Lentinus brumalis]|uniref:Uncharacterized protein n=1 Tax=Lentinus brumalis TaxID=2498619 RepID=A0A371CQW0_9APHY|nr:hypothetical protein OH76DRAFT_1410933 [Polyporus brumalis]
MDMSTTFAVVQLDPVKMVEHLDEIAMQRARELQPGLYLVFIEGVHLPIIHASSHVPTYLLTLPSTCTFPYLYRKH